MLAFQLLFWLSLAGLAYIYAGYPLTVWAAGKLRPQASESAPYQGTLSVVIVGHNEAHRLPAKLDSLFASDMAEQIAEVLVGSDGSTDETTEVLENYPDDRVRLVAFDDRRGKPAVLNDVVPMCTSELVVLTDARQPLKPTALSLITSRFSDPRVGVVSGELTFRSGAGETATAQGVGAYWTYEKLIRKSESRFRSVPGATGALYAVRRQLFRRVPENTLLDDVVIPMQAIEQGYRCVFEPGAIVWDMPSQSTDQETVRKRRTIAGCAQLVRNQPRWLLPWRNPIWWEYVSHKLARLTSPVLLVALLGCNVLLADRPLYAGLLVGQGLFYASAAGGWWMQRRGRGRWLGVSLMFLSLNVTTLAALWDATRGRFQATWQKTT